MICAPPDDDSLASLRGTTIPSEVQPGVSYRLVSPVGEGGMSVAFYALRVTPDGEIAVVVKVVRPSFVHRAGPTAALIVMKEAIALGRLNERVPPTPFVVRFIDAGAARVHFGDTALDLPWVAVEYVNGGAEGTTLSERVERSLRTTGAAFDPARAAHAIECLTQGMLAVHEVGVIHRDLKPDNVLCCGFGSNEILKIADFGVARPAGVATFAGSLVGTPGFVAPELAFNDPSGTGPWSDIFSLAAVFFYVLTGEDYFEVSDPGAALAAAIMPERRSIRDTRGLSLELRGNERACRAIDLALAAATNVKIELRPQRADALAAMLLPWLPAGSLRPSALARKLSPEREDADADEHPRWEWTTLRNPNADLIVRSVGWDADGRCMAATTRGLVFWNGASWTAVETSRFPTEQVRFVQRIGPGKWLVGADDATFATYTSAGVQEVRRLHGPLPRFDRLSGDLDDLAVMVGSSPGSPPVLCALSGRRWLKPLPLPDVAAIASLARVEDARWLIAGRGTDGQAYAALYAPLEWEVERITAPTPPAPPEPAPAPAHKTRHRFIAPADGPPRAYLACAGLWDRDVGLVAGAGGAVLWRHGGQVVAERVGGGFDLSAASIDSVGRGWAAAAGKIWLRRGPAAQGTPGAQGSATGDELAATPTGPRWECLWTDPTLISGIDALASTASTQGQPMPIVSLFTDLGVVIGMTAQGGIIEGRLRRPSSPV